MTRFIPPPKSQEIRNRLTVQVTVLSHWGVRMGSKKHAEQFWSGPIFRPMH
jgi:hypothetical protein